MTASLLLEASDDLYGSWRVGKNPFSVRRVTQAALFYYEKFELLGNDLDGDEKKRILIDLEELVNLWLNNDDTLYVSPYKVGSNALDWWRRQKRENPSIANLAMFLLDAPVQAANCERLFKEFSCLHTKVRNRLDPQTTHMMAQVKYDVRRKYGEDDRLDSESTKKSTNRFVSPREHSRADTPVSPAREGAGYQDEETIDITGEDDMVNEEEESDVDNNTGLVGDGDLLDSWLAALASTVSENSVNDEMFFETDEPSTGSGGICDNNDGLDYFEKRRADLPPLPKENDVKWPQENAAYFSRMTDKKNYVRTDKYKLALLHELCQVISCELPSIMSIYGKKAN